MRYLFSICAANQIQTYRREGVEKPLSWTESGHSVLKLNIRHLWLMGMWPLGHSSVFKLYTAFAFTLGLWSVVESLLAVYCTLGKLEETTLQLMITSTLICGFMKMVLFVSDPHSYNSMVRDMAGLIAGQDEDSSKDAALAAILHDSRRRAFRITMGMLLFMLSQCFIWYPIPLVVHAEDRRLPLSQHAWDNNSNYYALSYTVQCVCGLYVSQISFALDCLFASILILVVAQLKILGERILKLKQEVIPVEANENPRRWNQTPRDKHYDGMYRRLCVCIDSHQKILRFITHVQDAMSPIAMTQFASSVVIACMGLFQATYGEDMSVALKCASYLPIPGGQVYLYCWAAHSVTEEAASVSTAAYSCSWVEGSARFKHALRILIVRAQKPLVLTAGHLYPINKGAFLSLVNASYSYYALLGQMNKR
ncbi:odorant receptor Or2-like [Schistocerca nitens]|uniref:odorant receptor Or2-like n=1 Tax=Schistocerca nitens TaxID=7011 RepID=UPI0021177222|nr:odorant receptor Or2-like [Schistocerca nitens]